MVHSIQRQRTMPGETIFVTTRGNHPPAGACRITECLPDFAMLALPEADLRRIEDHVATCPVCQAELPLVLDAIAIRAMRTVAPPRPEVRSAFLSRACNAPDGDRRCDDAQSSDRNAPRNRDRRA